MSDKELMQQVRSIQHKRNFNKLIIVYVMISIVGLCLTLIKDDILHIDSFITTHQFGVINICMSYLMIGFWILCKRFKLDDKFGRYFCEACTYLSFTYVLMMDIFVMSCSNRQMFSFMLFALVYLFYIIVFDMSVIQTVIILVAISVIFTGRMQAIVRGETFVIAVMYIIVMIIGDFVLDKFSCKNLKIQLELQNTNDSMKKIIENAVKDVEIKDQKLRNIQESTVVGLANLIESRSGETGFHVKHTQILVNKLALKAYENGLYPDLLDEHYIKLCTETACLHDIGKITIADDILNAPRRLTSKEYDIMKTHTLEGVKAVENILGQIEDDEYLNIAKQITVAHHERWDGKGYPLGIKGEAIPLCARFMAIADVYEAMRSKRCYKEPIPKDEVIQHIKENAGTQFDPELAKLFVEMEDELF